MVGAGVICLLNLTGCQVYKNQSIHSVSLDWNSYREMSFWCEQRDHLPLPATRVAMTQWAYNTGAGMPADWHGTGRAAHGRHHGGRAASCPPGDACPPEFAPPNAPSLLPIPAPSANGFAPPELPPGPAASDAAPQGNGGASQLPAPPGWGVTPPAVPSPGTMHAPGNSGVRNNDLLDHAAPPNIPFGSGGTPATSRPSGELGPTAEASPSGIQPAGYSVAPVPRRLQTARPPVSRSWMFTN